MNLFPSGTYRGFTWSHDSPIHLCELECVIGDKHATLRFATGIRVETMTAPFSGARYLTAIEASARYPDGFSQDITGGMELGDRGICFVQLSPVTPENSSRLRPDDKLIPASDVARIIVLGIPGPGDTKFGGASLFTPEQVKAGAFDRAMARIEEDFGKNMLPRIASGGRPA